MNRQIPTVPAHVAKRRAAARALDHAMIDAINGTLRGDLTAVPDLKATIAELGDVLNPKTTAEEDLAEMQYRREVAEYNAEVEAHNNAIIARRQARVNAAEVRAVRAAACPQCFSTHAGEC